MGARYDLLLTLHTSDPGPAEIIVYAGLDPGRLLEELRRRDPEYLPGLAIVEWHPGQDEAGRRLWRQAGRHDAAEWLAANGDSDD